MFHFNRRGTTPSRRRGAFQERLKSAQTKPIHYPLKFEAIEWVPVNMDDQNRAVPSDAYVACKLETGEAGYVAKANVDWQIVTGVTTRDGMVASIPYGSAEHLLPSFEVLTTNNPDSLCWHKSSHGNVPKFAVKGGIDRQEQSYIGRTCSPLNEAKTYDGERLKIRHQCVGASRVGKVHPSHRCLYVSYNGKEYIFPSYEVLCHKVSPSSLAAVCRWKVLLSFQKLHKDKQAINELPIPTFLKTFLLKEDKMLEIVEPHARS